MIAIISCDRDVMVAIIYSKNARDHIKYSLLSFHYRAYLFWKKFFG